jgi:hypothetical protein
MRFNGKFYGDQAQREAVDSLWSSADLHLAMPLTVKDYNGNSIHARHWFDCAAIGVGWTDYGPFFQRRAAEDDSASLRMMRRMLEVPTDPQFEEAKTKAWNKVDALAYPPTAFPETPSALRDLSARYRAAARAFWKYALTRS